MVYYAGTINVIKMEQQNKETTGSSERKFYRSSTERIIGGVAGGLGEYFETDPVFFRIALVLMIVLGAGSAVVIAYLAACLLIPVRPSENIREKKTFSNELLGVIFMLTGLIILLDWFWPLFWMVGKFIGAVLLVLMGFYIYKGHKLLGQKKETSNEETGTKS
jgi:phage shock protein PspC (stress-responsive transcriptional regulator)